MRRPISFAVLIALPLSAGCYAYVPTTQSLAGRLVETRLTDSGSVVLASRVGPSIEQLRGRVVSESQRSVSLAVEEAINRDGMGTPWRSEVIDLPRPLINSIAVRQFSPTRTLLFAAITSTVLIAVERGFLGSGGANAAGTGQTGKPTGR